MKGVYCLPIMIVFYILESQIYLRNLGKKYKLLSIYLSFYNKIDIKKNLNMDLKRRFWEEEFPVYLLICMETVSRIL